MVYPSSTAPTAQYLLPAPCFCHLMQDLTPTYPTTHASNFTGRNLQYDYYREWPLLHCKPTAHHPKVRPRSHHSHDYTTVSSSILWNLLHHTLLVPLLTSPYYRNTQQQHRFLNSSSSLTLPSTQYKTYYYSNIALLPTATAISLAYLPALSTKFRRWRPTRHRSSYHQYQTLPPPPPATSDKNLLCPS